MSTTFQTGSYAAAADFTTVTIANSTLTGAGSFSEELTNFLAAGYKIGDILHDGSDYVAFMIQKKWN